MFECGAGVVIERVLDELEARQSDRIERLVIRAAGVANGDRAGGKVLDRGEPLLENRAASSLPCR